MAHAVLGRHTEDEDVVSDVWLRLAEANARDQLLDVDGWATVAVARRAVGVLRSARVCREAYVGPWLPEPVVGPIDAHVSTAADAVDPPTG